jgi:uncharacterized membrane protein YozB (DUF420 family)
MARPLASDFAAILAFVTLLNTVAVVATKLADPHTDFYRTAATVLPVFLITLVFQVKAFEPTHEAERLTSLLLLTVFMALAVVGEVAALKVLYDGRASEDELGWVVTALQFAGLGIVIGLVFRLVAPDGHATRRAIALGCILVGLVYAAGWVALENL